MTKKLRATKKLLAPGVQKPVYLLNFVTNKCSAKCEHCFYWKELNTQTRSELTIDEHTKIAKLLGAMFQITFTGGSPELRQDLPAIVYPYYKYCKPSNMTFCMLGYQPSVIINHVEKILKCCKNQQITIGISLDGIGKEHDDLRKLNGLFDKVIETINKLNNLKQQYSNLRTAVGMVVHGLNLQTVENSAVWVRKNLQVDILKPIIVRGTPLNISTIDKDCYEVYNRIIEHDKQFLKNKKQSNFTDRLIIAKEDIQRKIINNIVLQGMSNVKCSGGKETAVLYPTGNVAGCEMREDILGNLRDTNYVFSKIWFSDNAEKFRNSNGLLDVCKTCYHHCFISPAIFRAPALWPKLLKKVCE